MDVVQIQLDGNADAAEFCPDYPFQHILAAATYTLEEGAQHRVGSISLFSIQDKMHLKLLQRIKTSGVFDIKWRPGKGNTQSNLLQADSDGNLTVYSLEHPEIVSEDKVQEDEVVIKELVSVNISCSSMCLTVDWDQANLGLSSNIAVGLSEGLVSVVRLGEAQMQTDHTWQAHGFEVWSVSYDSCRPDVLYSGADDCNFCGWDLRESTDHPVFRNTKSHRMGVCSIQKSQQWENSIITGSYDECLRLWDLRLMERPVMQESIGLGGGVWKLKFHPSIGNLVLAACMHNGFAVVRLTNDGMKIVDEYKGHDSLAYGADWFKGDLSKKDRCGICVPEIRRGMNGLGQEEHLQHGGDSKFSNTKRSSITSGQCDDQSIALNECTIGENSNWPSNVDSAHQRTIQSLVATCSFYDKALHIWKPKIPMSDASCVSVYSPI
ncbi:uncharacterized protein LOC131069599 isoform X2 [Cryptomeria japonica]|nr:uncharacterized protein LOC131069599 isoform X2 [Cryptomeria japonica]XP_057861107.1 uncharacterized protein LOC131069599 isoform X2 [Cryptomeria japonica]XP_057861108.1 uncharacterized protein LOC131069599 isoform X2 [Cryptomeria japonica]